MSYDPRIGRWASEDPIAFEAGDLNLYRYVGNGPSNATDPTGLFEVPPPGGYPPIASTPVSHPPVPFPITGSPGTLVTNASGGAILDWFNPLAPTVPAMQAEHPFAPEKAPIPIPGKVGPPAGGGTNVSSGTHQLFPATLKPGQFVGTGGCATCVGLIIYSPGHGSAVFHFGPTNSSVWPTLNQYRWPEGSHAIICGGNGDFSSNVVMNNVINSLPDKGIILDGILLAANCFLGSDGRWYVDTRPGVFF